MSRKNEPMIRASGSSSEHYSQETRPSYSGFQSFLKWFRKNEQDRSQKQNISNSSSSHLQKNGSRYDSSDTIGPTSSPVSTPSSSCESIYSTATTGFAFIPPNLYKPFGDACQPEKRIAVGPVTDTYRDRIRAHQNAKEIDKHLELTLRKKYNIFDTDTINSASSIFNNSRNCHYTNHSLPQEHLEQNQHSPLRDITSRSTGTFGRRRRSHRRTVSDSSKDKRAGSYLHVKGKRKAPPPPPIEPKSMSSNFNGTLSPISTLGRKKRRAPPPPIRIEQCLNDDIPRILTDGLFDDAEIQAIIGGAGCSSQFTAENMDNKIEDNVTSDQPSENSTTQCTDTLKLERGVLKSNRLETVSPPPKTQFLDIGKTAAPLSVSPISPRPWYKRSSVTNKDNSIPFKREVTLKTMEKRKLKNENKEVDVHSQLPVVTYSRNSSLFDGFFSRVKHHHDRHDDNEKRRSGINMPNISELDREAAEIVSKEQARKVQEDDEKYFSSPSGMENDSVSEIQRTSTKDLITKFEETNAVKFTVNDAFIDKTDREKYFGEPTTSLAMTKTITPPNERDIIKNRSSALQTTGTTESSLLSSSSSSASSSSSSMSMTQSIFSNLKQTLNTTATPSAASNSDSKGKLTAHNETMTTTTIQQKENNFEPDARNTANEKKATTWICSYCTLENYNWRVICEVCERIKPYEKQCEPARSSTITSAAACTDIDEKSRLRYTKNVDQIKSPDRIVNAEESSADRIMNYLRNKPSVASTLSKSASETSVNIIKKPCASSVSKLTASPKLTPKQRQSDVIRNKLGNESNSESALSAQRKQGLIDSSAVITTQTSVYVAPLPIKHSENVHTITGDQPSIDELRAVRVAKFSETRTTEQPNETERITKPALQTSVMEKPLLTDHNSLEREKQRLRDMIRAMNAKALAEKYPVIKKEVLLVAPTTKEEVRSAENKIETNVANDDATRLGAIKKLFHRKSERDDNVIADNTNYITSKIEQDKKIYKEPFSKASIEAHTPTVRRPEMLMLPAPILEMNENDISPIFPVQPSLESIVDKEIDNIYAQLKMDIPNDEINLTEISQQLNSTKGLEDFKSTLKSSSKHMSNTNTLALNKILKNLEVAICDGNHEQAATLAMDLAKMKVSLCVTKIRESSPSMALQDSQLTNSEAESIMVDMFIDQNKTHKGPISLKLSPTLTVLDLKQRISMDFQIPIEKQRWILNNKLALIDAQLLSTFNIKEKSIIYLYIVSTGKDIPTENSAAIKNTKPSNIIDQSNEKNLNFVSIFNENEGAKALPLLLDDPYGTLKIGWTCPLCTLINSPNRPGCVACSETRPSAYIVPAEYKIPENTFEINDHSQKIIVDDENNKVPQLQVKNDLNRTTANRKSTEIFNIIVKEELPKLDEQCAQVSISSTSTTNQPNVNTKNIVDEKKPKVVAVTSKQPIQTAIIMTAITASPNITKNKYRGVDNYNPQLINKPDTKGIPYKSPLVKPLRTTRISQPLDVKPYIGRAVKYIETKETAKTTKVVNVETENFRNSEHYSELLSLDKNSIVANVDPFECPICFLKYNAGEGIVLRECIHTFCRECIINTVKYSDEAEVKCPYMDKDYSCDCVIQEREIRSLLTKEAYDQHLAVSLSLAEHRTENAFHCKTPGCRGWCIYEDNVNQFKCPICKITNCLTCRVIHDGLNCKQYQDRMDSDCDSSLEALRTGDMLAEMINKGEAMKCPICQVILMKKWGCDWLKCSMCKTEICWVTRGIRWGPEGKGDTSAGCKCGVNGVKCHPKCNYCH